TEHDRQAINAWIRKPGHFDAVLDFDALLRDPADPRRMRHDLDSGDGLHPSNAGYEAMANAVPLALFAEKPSPREGPAIALTFDDLPVHGPLPQGVSRLDVVRSIAGSLRAAGVEEAYGFVNASAIAQDPSLMEALCEWCALGYPLGNHSWSHPNLN